MTLGVGFGLILAGAIETDIHHRTQGRVFPDPEGERSAFHVVEPQIILSSSPAKQTSVVHLRRMLQVQ
jgi:hypothetical protein